MLGSVSTPSGSDAARQSLDLEVARQRRRQQKGSEMAIGKVLWFNPVMGHGYIEPSDRRTDVPVDRLAVELAGQKTLKPGQKLHYEVARGLDGRPRATTLRLID
jgi:cold shock CspA family protein